MALSSTIRLRASTPSSNVIDGQRRTAAIKRAHDLTAGAVAGRVHDPVAAVRGFEAEPPAAVRPPVEGDAKSGEMFDRRRGRVDDAARDGFIAKARACGERIGQMQRRVVIPAHRRGKSALRPQARSFRPKRRFRHQQHRFRRHLQRRHQSGGAAANDDGTVVER